MLHILKQRQMDRWTFFFSMFGADQSRREQASTESRGKELQETRGQSLEWSRVTIPVGLPFPAFAYSDRLQPAPSPPALIIVGVRSFRSHFFFFLFAVDVFFCLFFSSLFSGCASFLSVFIWYDTLGVYKYVRLPASGCLYARYRKWTTTAVVLYL